MSNDDVGKTEHSLDIRDQHFNHRKKFSVRGYFKVHPKIERNLLVSLIVVSVSLDPLFFYISVVKNDLNCLGLDKNLRIIIVFLRTIVGGLYIILWFHKLASLHKKRRPRILSWIVAILAVLPLPQVVVYVVSWQLLAVKLLKFVVLTQFVPRIYLIVPSYQYARERSYKIINMWAAATFYLFMFILASNVVGAFWYEGAIERNMDCWKKACKTRGLCGVSSLNCDDSSSNNRYLEEFCPIPPVSKSTFFDYGIYLDAFQKDVMGSRTNFLDRLFYCLWWGLESLSSFGQTLDPGTYIWDNFFAIFIVISGLILFALLIGNMQVYLQRKTITELENAILEKIESEKTRMMKKIRKAQIDAELCCWRPFYKLPRTLRKEIKLCEDDKWLGTTEVNVESVLKNTPFTLRKDLKLHLCRDLFSQVEMFEGLNPVVKERLRMRAKPVVYQAKTVIHKEGYPIHEMIHIVQGEVLAFNKDSHKKEGMQWHAHRLEINDSFGKELMDKVFESPLRNRPLATETVQSLTKVEAFALSYDDIVGMLSKHGYLSRSNLERWAANVIGNAFTRRAAFRVVGKPSHGK